MRPNTLSEACERIIAGEPREKVFAEYCGGHRSGGKPTRREGIPSCLAAAACGQAVLHTPAGPAIARSSSERLKSMSVDIETVRRVARLARIAVTSEEAERMTGELNQILGFVEQLNEVDVSGVEPMTSVIPMRLKERQDVVTAGGIPEDIVANAPATAENFFLVPKVIE